MFQPSRVGNGLCSLTLQVFEQAVDQVPVHLIYLDPTADVLDVKVHLLRLCATVSQLQLTNVLWVHMQLTGDAVAPSQAAHLPPTCMAGRRSASGSASLSTSWVTGAVSPSPNNT